MSIYRIAGIIAGIIVGLLICAVLFRFANTNKKLKTDYDERQRSIRNLAYKYSFYTVMFYEVLMLILGVGEIEIPIPDYAVHFFGIILGCTVLGVYCILKDVYWGMNNNRKRYILVFAVAAALNIIPVAGSIAAGSYITDGKVSFPVVNLMVLFMLLVLLIAFLLKSVFDKNADSGEDEA